MSRNQALYEDAIHQLEGIVEALRRDVAADAVLMFDARGEVLAAATGSTEFDSVGIGRLVASRLDSPRSVAGLLRDALPVLAESISRVHAFVMASRIVLLVLCPHSVSVGLVKLHVGRARERIEHTCETMRTLAGSQDAFDAAFPLIPEPEPGTVSDIGSG